jgi:site-specific recombinase XerD
MDNVASVRVPGPLGQYAEGFRDELARLGYTPLSAIVHMRLMARLSRWLAERALEADALTTATVETFFAERREAGYFNSRTPRSVRPLVAYLQGTGVVAPSVPAAPTGPTELLLARYAEHLRVERGLAAATVSLNVRLVRPFLDSRAQARDGRLELDRLTAREVNAVVLEWSRDRPRSAKRIVTALRSLLRFLYVEGLLAEPLGQAVPSPAGWALVGVPKALEPAQVEALLASCDRGTPTGRRDFAILTVLARLGLRAGEVAALRLDDVDWRRGELRVRGKANRHDALPLPADVGQAVAGYLADGRPGAALDRTVFVRAQAPYRALKTGGVIQVVVVAGRRCGLGPLGAHRLRHSAATAVLRGGGSLEEIGQLLRHTRAATTAIYLKVDVEGLRRLARPWPGAAA